MDRHVSYLGIGIVAGVGLAFIIVCTFGMRTRNLRLQARLEAYRLSRATKLITPDEFLLPPFFDLWSPPKTSSERDWLDFLPLSTQFIPASSLNLPSTNDPSQSQPLSRPAPLPRPSEGNTSDIPEIPWNTWRNTSKMPKKTKEERDREVNRGGWWEEGVLQVGVMLRMPVPPSRKVPVPTDGTDLSRLANGPPGDDEHAKERVLGVTSKDWKVWRGDLSVEGMPKKKKGKKNGEGADYDAVCSEIGRPLTV